MNHHSAASLLLRDWASGKLPRFCNLPSEPVEATAKDTQEYAEIYKEDTEILANILSRKEFMKTTGALRLRTADVDQRVPIMEDWDYEEEESGDEDDEDEDDDALPSAGMADLAMDHDDDEEDDDDDDEDEGVEAADDNEDADESDEAPQLLDHGKLKRRRNQPAPKLNKKVSFAPSTKGRQSKKPRQR